MNESRLKYSIRFRLEQSPKKVFFKILKKCLRNQFTIETLHYPQKLTLNGMTNHKLLAQLVQLFAQPTNKVTTAFGVLSQRFFKHPTG